VPFFKYTQFNKEKPGTIKVRLEDDILIKGTSKNYPLALRQAQDERIIVEFEGILALMLSVSKHEANF
jgi:hypothetical protein